MTRAGLGVILLLVIFITVVSSGCAELPPQKILEDVGFLPTETATTETPEPVAYVTPATPYGYEMPPATREPTCVATEAPTPVPETYTEIYNETLTLNYNTVAVLYDLNPPPMVISYTVTPEYTTRTKFVTSQYGSKEEMTVTVTQVSETSWCEITVRDNNTGEILEQDRFGRFASIDTQGQLTVRKTALCHIEITGNDVILDVEIKVRSI